MSLIDSIKKARESNVEIDGVTFTIRRPTDYEAITRLTGANAKQVITEFVTDWQGINECDLVPGGNPEPVPFSTVVFEAWAEDNLSVWPKLVDAISDAYKLYRGQKDDALKKPEAG